MNIIIEGIISSGFGEGKFFTQLDWVVNQFKDKLGFVPFPGTLNIDIDEQYQADLRNFIQGGGIVIEAANKNFCTGLCFKALIDDLIEGAVVIPAVTKHPAGRLEIVAPVGIKKNLNIEDGDRIRLTLYK